MDKQKLEAEKMALIWQFNIIQEHLDSYWLPEIATDSGVFKDWIIRRQAIEMRIKEINRQLEDLDTKI